MEWNEFQLLEPGDRVLTSKWGEATVKKWVNDKRLEVELYRFQKPNTRCKKFARTEINIKL